MEQGNGTASGEVQKSVLAGTDIGGSVSIILMSAERFLFGIFVNDAGVVEIGIRMMM